MYDECYQNLANAIVYQAYTDLKRAAKLYQYGKNTEQSDLMIRETLDFFHSDYYSILTTIDSGIIVRRILDELIRKP